MLRFAPTQTLFGFIWAVAFRWIDGWGNRRPLPACILITIQGYVIRPYTDSQQAIMRHINKGWMFLKKLWCCVGRGNKVIWLYQPRDHFLLYQLSWKCKLARAVMSYKADVSSVMFGSRKDSLWRRANARHVSFILITVANLHFRLSWYNQII